MKVFRYKSNPIIKPEDIEPSRSDFKVVGAFNAGVAKYKKEVVLLIRVAEKPITQHPDMVPVCFYDLKEQDMAVKLFSKDDKNNDLSDPRFVIRPTERFLTSASHLRVAKSIDGINFEIGKKPALQSVNKYEIYGLEDPRISFINGLYYITYVAVSPYGIVTSLASTKDFKTFKRHGIIWGPDNKDVILFDEKINNKYYALHRPFSQLFGNYEMWVAESDNLIHWGNHQRLITTRPNSWESVRIGGSAVPLKIQAGWLVIYHGVDDNQRYCLGAMLLDKNDPAQIIARSDRPIFEPETDYECEGFFGDVVFPCGLLFDNETLKLYYGAADTSLCYAELKLEDVIASLS